MYVCVCVCVCIYIYIHTAPVRAKPYPKKQNVINDVCEFVVKISINW